MTTISHPPADHCDGKLLRNDWRVGRVGDDRTSCSLRGAAGE